VRSVAVAALVALVAPVAAPTARAMPLEASGAAVPATAQPVAWRQSRAIGLPYAGRLARGVQLPSEGRDFWTYDWGLRRSPNRPWRRWGTDGVVRTVLGVVAAYRAAHPSAARVGIADLSRTHGGEFGARFGGAGHVSHQNGLDVDVLYPRRDGAERVARSPRLVDERLAQDLVRRFVRAGATQVFTGWSLHLGGPRRVVMKLARHDDHMHVRMG
jgi:murein endopeptidase